MNNKWKLFNIFKYLKKLVFRGSIATFKCFGSKNFHKLLAKSNFKNSFINKLTKSYTATINNLFMIFIVGFCLSIIGYTCYEQKREFELNLLNKNKELVFQIEELIGDYKSSMEALSQVILAGDLYKQDEHIIQLLKLTYMEDEHLKLLPITFNSTACLHKTYSVYGITENDLPDNNLRLQFQQSSKKFSFYNKKDKRKQQNLFLNLYLHSSPSSLNSKPQLIGWLSLPISLPMILAKVNKLHNHYLVKVIRDNVIKEDSYFLRNQFLSASSPLINSYQFSKPISISNFPYLIAVGRNKEIAVKNILWVCVERCSIILLNGLTMLLFFNYLERRKFRKQCVELYNEEVDSLNQQIEKLKSLNQQNDNKDKKLILLDTAIKTFSMIEARAKQERDKTIGVIQDSLKLKGLKVGEEVTITTVTDLFKNIYSLVENLRNNIFSKTDEVAKVNLNKLINEIIPIFDPILEERSIILINKVKNINLIINEFILEQILISLITRSLCFVPENGEVTISANQDKRQNKVTLEINDNGMGLDDSLFKNVIKGKINDLFDMANILLDPDVIEKLIKEKFKGNIQVARGRNGNWVTISLPIELNKENKVIPMPIQYRG